MYATMWFNMLMRLCSSKFRVFESHTNGHVCAKYIGYCIYKCDKHEVAYKINYIPPSSSAFFIISFNLFTFFFFVFFL